MASKYTVKYGYHHEVTRECDTWSEVEVCICEFHLEARNINLKLERGDNLIVMGPNYDVGGPDERVHWGLSDQEESELEALLDRLEISK